MSNGSLVERGIIPDAIYPDDNSVKRTIDKSMDGRQTNEGDDLMIEVLKNRFLDNPMRHQGIAWEAVEMRLNGNPEALAILKRMEESGGEPDAIGFDEKTGGLIFCDCSKESPTGRRSLCYDDSALLKRKKNPPTGSAVGQAHKMGVELMTEALYRRLQELGEFDLKTSSWIATPEAIRQKGGALFCEKRYGVVFTFHNGADSYYAARGWRGYFQIPA
ncbi:DUF4256 domain-containing protein [Pseudoscardovia radai]|nr:DUF4256 domain-containing protein [Pseudoscardovia radai]